MSAESAERLPRQRVLVGLLAIYAITLALSLYRIDIPLLEFFPVRQVQTAEIARNLYRADHNLFLPKRLDGATLVPFVVEFPLYNGIAAVGYWLTGGVHETVGRVISLISWLAAGLCLFVLTRRYFGDAVALGGLLFFHMSRMGIMVSRSYQPDAMMMLCGVVALLAWDTWARDGRFSALIAATAAGALALLVKLPIVHMALPIAYLAWFAPKECKRTHLMVAAAATLAIAAAWYLYAWRIAMAFTPSFAATAYTVDDRFSPALLAQWDFYQRIYVIWRGQALGTVTFGLALFGVFMRVPDRRHLLFHAWLVSIVLYVLVFNRHAMTHDYYNLPIAAVGAVFAGRALVAIPEVTRSLMINPRVVQAVILLLTIVTTATYMRGRAYAVPLEMRGVAELAPELRRLPPDTLVVATNVTRYHADRGGWELRAYETDAIERLEKMRTQGADVYATGDREELERGERFHAYVRARYPVLKETDRYVIFDLTQLRHIP